MKFTKWRFLNSFIFILFSFYRKSLNMIEISTYQHKTRINQFSNQFNFSSPPQTHSLSNFFLILTFSSTCSLTLNLKYHIYEVKPWQKLGTTPAFSQNKQFIFLSSKTSHEQPAFLISLNALVLLFLHFFSSLHSNKAFQHLIFLIQWGLDVEF